MTSLGHNELSNYCETGFTRKPCRSLLINEKSQNVWVMAWWHQSTSHTWTKVDQFSISKDCLSMHGDSHYKDKMVLRLSHLYLCSPDNTEVKQCIFHGLIVNDIAQKEMVLNGSIIHYLIMITCISYEIIFTIYLYQNWLILLHFKPV